MIERAPSHGARKRGPRAPEGLELHDASLGHGFDWLRAVTWRVYDIDRAGHVLATSDEANSNQLFVVGDGATRQVTDLPFACTGRLSGDAILVEHDGAGDGNFVVDRVAQSAIDVLGRPATEADLEPVLHDPSYFCTIKAAGENWIAYATNRRNGVDLDLVLRDIRLGTERTLFANGGFITYVSVHADGESPLTDFAFALTTLGPGAHETEVWFGNTDVQTQRLLTEDRGYYSHVAVAADHQTIVLASDVHGGVSSVVKCGLRTSPEVLFSHPSAEVYPFPSPSGRYLAVDINDNGRSSAVIIDQSTDLQQQVDLEGAGQVHMTWSSNSRWFAIQYSAIGVGCKILTVDVSSGTVACVAGQPDGVSAALETARVYVEATSFAGLDGEQVPCFIYRSDQTPTDQAPTVVLLHGGPEAQERPEFSPLKRLLLDAGFLVVAPNVRGSTGYGRRWVGLDDRRLRMDSVRDMEALSGWLDGIGGASSNASIVGASYGGYMVLSGLCHQPNRWRAGVDIMGIASLVTLLEETAPYLAGVREAEYGSLVEDRDFLIQASPMTYADQIVSPLLLVHGANDPGVPATESMRLHEKLVELRRPVELVMLRDEGHGLSMNHNKRTVFSSIVDFLIEAAR